LHRNRGEPGWRIVQKLVDSARLKQLRAGWVDWADHVRKGGVVFQALSTHG